MTDPNRNQGSMEDTEARLREPAVTGPDASVAGGAVPRPCPSRVRVHDAGRAPSPMTDAEKLDEIRRLCNDFPPDAFASWKMRDEVRAVLDAPSAPAARAGGIVAEEFDRLLADDTASIGWVHDLPVYTAERLGHLRRIILEQLEAEPVPSVSAAQPHDADLREALGDELRSAYGVTPTDATLDAILAVVRPAPPALDLAVVRRILTAALPADPKWGGWVDGRIEEIAAVTPSAGVVLTPEEAGIALEWRADAQREGWVYPAAYGELAARLEAAS